MEKLRVCFIGTGSMGSAVLKGLLASGYEKKLISATTASEESASNLRSLGISALSLEQSADANQLLSSDAQIVVLGVKPYKIAGVLSEIKPELSQDAIVVSMAAGIELASMAQKLPDHKNLIRTMPNTPCLVGRGVTGIAAGPLASSAALEASMNLFRTVGEVVEVREDQINALSAISGSGPAWLMFIVEKWEEVAVAKGFSKEQAATLVRSTLIGSAELLDKTGEEPDLLRKKVTSPGGTTEKIIETLDQANLAALFDEALENAVKRANEIASAKD